MENRSFARTDTHLPVKYYCDNTLYTGIIKNISENGMYICTSNFLPCTDMIEMLIPLQEKVSRFFVKIRRIEKVNDSKLNVGIEIIDPPESYVEYVEGLKAAVRSHSALRS